MKIITLNHNNLSNQKDISKRNTCSFLLPQNYKLLKTDTVSFKKQYTPQERGMEDVSVVELMAHNYLDLRRKDWGSSIVYDDLTPHNISDKLKENFLDVITKVGPAVHADANLVEWKTFLNTDYKMASCKGVNKARSDRLRDYSAVNRINVDKTFLAQDMALYIDKLKNNSAYQFLAMIIAFNDVKKSNRHIPLPFNVQVLAKTFAQIDENREIMSIDKLSKLYHSNLIEYALINNPERIIHIDDKAPVSDMKHCWICVPGRTKDDVIQNNFINLVEIFSNINWCTHSREDKARAQVETGDFFVYLKRDEDNNWTPMTAISTDNRYKKQEQLGVIELQGIKNNYILTDEDYDRIKLLMQKIDKKLKFKHRDINDNVPTACVQMSIMKYLEKGSPLANAISEIRNANEQIYDMKAQSVKYREKIKLLKPSPNLSMEYSERLKTESEIQQLNEKTKALEQKILNIKEKNKVLYNNLFQVIGANPTSTEYSVINTMKVLNKVLDYDLKDITYDNINIHQIDLSEQESKTYPTISSTNVSIPIKATKADFSKKVLINKLIQTMSKLNLNELATSENLLSLGIYNPIVDIDSELKQKRPYCQVPLMYFGIDEDDLLCNVKTIDIFYMKNSGIKKFPKNLSIVNKLYCNDAQYRKFKNEINLLKARNPQMQLHISNSR